MSAPHLRKHIAIALVSGSVVLLQIAVTRVLSVLLWYHWAFFTISLAMLGMGAPGVWLALTARRPKLDTVLLAAGVLVPLGLAAMIRWQHLFGALAIVFCMACLLPAFLCLGTCVCLLLLEAEGPHVARMYGSDLFGACVGALTVVPLMTHIATPELAACAGLLPLVAHELCAPEHKRWRARVAAVALGVSIAIAIPYRIERTKQSDEAGGVTPMFVRWTPTARLAIFPSIPWTPEGFRWGLGSKAANAPAPRQLWLEQDGSAGTPITQYDGDNAKLAHLFYDVTSVGYQLRNPAQVAIVGAGGGRDILTAYLAGAKRIDAIELNPGIVAAMRQQFAKFSGNVYDLPGVRTIVGEGRSVLTRSAGNYDLIQISMIDSWAATAAGAYSLSENNLYTLEAYRLYFARLSPHGMVATSRWLSAKFGFEIPRLLFLVKAALLAEGVADPIEHLAVIQAGTVATVLMSKSPFSEQDVAKMRDVAAERGFTVALPSPNSNLLERVIENGPAPMQEQGFVLSPPTDDTPFFFQMISPFATPTKHLVKQLGFNAQAVGTLRTLMIAMTIVTLLLFFAPFAVARWLPRGEGFWNGSGYFLSIGLGFMLLEIGWLQRSVLYLGHPSLAATAVLGFMLLGAGAGSTLSRRLDIAVAERQGWLLALVCALVNLALTPTMNATLGWPLMVRLVITGVMLVPAGFLMGFAFPIGMVAFGDRHRAWYWAINGAASVLASVVSLALAMNFGFLRTGYLGAALYLPAWLLLKSRNRGRPLRDGLVAIVATPLAIASVWQVSNLVRTIAGRIRYPSDLEWMEGGQLLTAYRLLQGQSIYDACSDGFIPFAYPPVHALLVAIAGAIFGLDYPVARWVSVCAFGCACVLLCREVHWAASGGSAVRGTVQSSRGWFAALVALGWLAASYPAAGSWYDLVRVDSTCLGFLVLGAVLSLPRLDQSARRRLSLARIATAALCLTAAIYAKQTAALFVPWIVVFAIWRQRQSGLYLGLAIAGLCSALLLALNLASHGRFWLLIFDVMRRHPLLPDRFHQALLRVFAFAPYLLFLPAVVGFLWLKGRLTLRTGFWCGMCFVGVIASLVTAAKIGAYINNIMTAAIFSPPAAIMLASAWLDRCARRSARRAATAGVSVGAFALLLSVQRFEVDELVPDARRWQAAVSLNRFVRNLPGGVLFPAHSFLPIRQGHRNRQMHEQGYVDVMGAGIETLDVTQCLAQLDARWLIVNDVAEPHLGQLLSVMYEPRGPLPSVAYTVLGIYTLPTRLYERRPQDGWHLARHRVRDLFDFEEGSLVGWEQSGEAFAQGITRGQLDYQQPIVGHRGHFLANSYHPSLLDRAVGTLTSPEFVIDRRELGFRMGGGSSKRLRVALTVDGEVVRSTQGVGRDVVEVLLPVVWQVADLLGRKARIVIQDDETGGWGHVLADAFELFDPD